MAALLDSWLRVALRRENRLCLHALKTVSARPLKGKDAKLRASLILKSSMRQINRCGAGSFDSGFHC